MNPIKKIFNKFKSDRKFREAGPGHRLDEAAERRNAAGQSTSGSSRSVEHNSSEEAQRAGAAALARAEQKESSVNWSFQATKAKARKELELENAVKDKPAPILKNESMQNNSSTFSVSEVYFTCPFIGPEILPEKEMEEKIETFLYEQYEEEKGLTACLIIHTVNRNRKKVLVGIETLVKYLTNILDNPNEEKYRKIRLKNKVFQEKVIDLKGALEFLAAAGFSRQVIDDEEFLVCLTENDEDLENLQTLKEALLSAEPILPSLDRNVKVLRPAQAAIEVNLPNSFFNLSVEELKREQEAKTEAIELMTQMRTKAMRERDEIKEYRVYKYSLIRIRFPDGIVLQGTFYVHEKLSAVKEFVTENINDPEKTFQLLLPGGSKLTNDTASLLQLKLVPAVLLHLVWQDSSPEQNTNCLKPDIIVLLSDV